MKQIKYIVYQEGKYFVSQCLNVDVSSFGETIDEAIRNLKEAVDSISRTKRRDWSTTPSAQR